MKRLEARRLHAKCMLTELGRTNGRLTNHGENTTLKIDRYERYLGQIRHAAKWIICDAPHEESLLNLRLTFSRNVIEFSLLRLSERIDSPLPDFPSSKKGRLKAAHILMKSEDASDIDIELRIYLEYILLLSDENTRDISDLAYEAYLPTDDISPARMILGSHLLQLGVLDSDARGLIMQRLLHSLSCDLETVQPPLYVSVEVAQVILGAYRDQLPRLPWVPDQVPHILALATPYDATIGGDLATAISKSAYRLDQEITRKTLSAAATSVSVAEVLAGQRWRTLSSEQKRTLIGIMLRHAPNSISTANILGTRRWFAIPQELRADLLKTLTKHAATHSSSACVLARRLWDFLDNTQRQETLTLLLRYAPKSRDPLVVATKDRWTDLTPSQRSDLLETLGRVARTDEMVAIVALKERWSDLGAYRKLILEYLIERSRCSGQASVVLVRDLWESMSQDERTRALANVCEQAERDPQVAIVACKSILAIVGNGRRQQFLGALLHHSKQDVAAATVLVQHFWEQFDQHERSLVTSNLLRMSRTNSSAAVAVGTYLLGTPELDNERSADLATHLFEFSQKDWRAAVVLAESFGSELTGKKRAKVATQLFLLSRQNWQCAKAAERLQDSLTEEQRIMLRSNLDDPGDDT